MARGSHWWREPPLWAWIAMVVAAVSVAVLIPRALQRSAPAEVGSAAAAAAASSGEAASSTTTAPSASGTDEPATPQDGTPLVAVLGDGDSAGDTAWPAVLQEEMGDVSVEVAAQAGAGYVTAGLDGRTIPELAEDLDLATADLVVVFGSRNDAAVPAEDVGRAADELFDRLREEAEGVELLVVGPAWLSGPAPDSVRAGRDAIRAAAESADATFVDPLTEGWFADRPELVTATENPSGEGQEYLAGLVEPAVRQLLAG